MMTNKKQKAANDRRIEKIYGANCSGVQIPLMAIPQVFAVGTRVIFDGGDDATIAKAIMAYVDTIRTN